MSWIKSTSVVSLITILLFVVIEIIFRTVYTKDIIQNDPELMRAIYGDRVDQAYEMFEAQGFGQMYVPFVEYVERPRYTPFVTVMSSGNRCHYRPIDKCEVNGGEDEIWVIGGSTTFGYSVADSETISAYLSDFYDDKIVHNFGAASYYSTQENYRLLELLKIYNPPGLVVFIDGLNDVANFQFPDKTMASDGIQRRVEGSYFYNSFLFAARGIVEQSELLKFLVLKEQEYREFEISNEQISAILKRFNFNIQLREAIKNTFNINVVTVLQPVPQKGDYEKSSIPIRFSRADGLIEHTNTIYEELKDGSTSHSVVDLTTISFNGARYVDSVHYTPEFNLHIAKEIFEKLK